MNSFDIESVVVEGHCDIRGSDEYNQSLGLRRANAVRDYLYQKGIKVEIEAVSFGKTMPVSKVHAENRRCVIIRKIKWIGDKSER